MQICNVCVTFLGDSSRRRRLDAEICAKEEVNGGGDVDGDALGVDEAGKLCQHLVFRVRQKFLSVRDLVNTNSESREPKLLVCDS